jgi:uncharacterized membrane protein YhaH (DUF805 family)
MDWGHLLFGFNGRINRAKYWLWVLFYVVVALVVTTINYLINSPVVGGIIGFGFLILVIVTGLAVWSKRLHDRNKSAWYILLFWVAPGLLAGIGAGITYASGESIAANIISLVFSLAALGILIWAFVELACLRGTAGPNQYGPDPLEPGLTR